MNKKEFRKILSGAILGDKDCLERIIDMYNPLIDRLSVVEGIYDEDLRQYMLEHLIRNISKFNIDN